MAVRHLFHSENKFIASNHCVNVVPLSYEQMNEFSKKNTGLDYIIRPCIRRLRVSQACLTIHKFMDTRSVQSVVQ